MLTALPHQPWGTTHTGQPQPPTVPRSEPEGGRPAAAGAQAARRFLDDKVAQAVQLKYNESDLPAWVLKMRNYVISVYPDALPLLKWAEFSSTG